MTAFARFLAIFLSLASLSESRAQEYKLSPKQVLNMGTGAEPRELDPTLAVGEPEGFVLDNLFEGLVSMDMDTLEPKPAIAESWTISPDGKTYTFKIRKEARWSDGTALTAEDFVWSWIRALAPLTASEYAYQLYYIKNGEDFNKGKIKDANQVGVKAIDKQTLRVELVSPTAFFLKLTSFRTLFPTPKHVVTKFKGQDWTKEENIVSNGPYKLTEWKLNRHIKVIPNPFYWDKTSSRFEEIFFYPIENSDTEEKMFLSGKLHLTYTLPPVRIPKYEKEAKQMGDNAIYSAAPQLASYFYNFNTTRKPLNDKRVRRALALTVDRTEITRNVMHAGQIPATNFTPSVHGYSFKGNLPETVTPAAIAEAKRLLTEAGYPGGKGMPKIDIHYNTLEQNKKVAVAIQSMWRKNLGLDIGIFNQEWKVYLDTQKRMDFSISRAGWVADYPDPNTFLDLFLTNGGNNHTKWSNKNYDNLIHLAGQTLDEKKRFEYFHQAEAILMDEMPVLPLFFYTKPRLTSPNLKKVQDGKFVKWVPNILDRIVYKNLALVEKK